MGRTNSNLSVDGNMENSVVDTGQKENKPSFGDAVDNMSGSALMAANLMFVLTMRHESNLSKEDSCEAIGNLCAVMKSLDDSGFFDKFDADDRGAAKSIIARGVMINGFTAESVCEWYEAGLNVVNEHVGSLKVNELMITTLCRAMSKYSDFAYGLVVYGDIDLDKYDEVVDSSNKVFIEFISRSMATFRKIKKNDDKASFLMFMMIVEDIMASTLNPLIDAISNDAVLRKQFVNNSFSTLQTIRMHLNKKFNNTILLTSELLELGQQERYSGIC